MANTCKYYKEQKYVSYNSGNTWSPLNEYRRGDLYEEDSADCGYVVVYKWEVISGYTCSGCTKYQKTQKYVSYDGGTTWSAVSPAEYGIGNVIEYGSEYCGCSTQYRWVVAASEYICSGTSKYTKEYYQVSYDGGSTWQNVVPQQTRAGELIESASTDCGYIQPIYRTLSTATTCVGYDKYTLAEYQISYDDGFSWSTTATSATTLIEADSEDCGYVPPIPSDVKLYSRLNNNLDPFIVYCDDTCGGEDPTHLVWTCAAGTTASTHMLTAQIGTCVSQIGNEAFYGCYSLEIVEIPSTVTSIGASAFTNCYSLISITIPSGVTVISDSMCYSCGLNHTPFTVNMPNSITNINYRAFYGCQTLESIELSSNLVTIGEEAFYNCNSLKEITIPNNVTEIGNAAFGMCSVLSAVTIGSGVEKIRESAFFNTYGLETVTVLATTPPEASISMFYRINGEDFSGNIYVPSGSVETYKSASGWTYYASRIQAIPNS